METTFIDKLDKDFTESEQKMKKSARHCGREVPQYQRLEASYKKRI